MPGRPSRWSKTHVACEAAARQELAPLRAEIERLKGEIERVTTLSRQQAEELARLHGHKNRLRDALMAEREMNVAMRDEDTMLRNSEIPPRYWQARINSIDKAFKPNSDGD